MKKYVLMKMDRDEAYFMHSHVDGVKYPNTNGLDCVCKVEYGEDDDDNDEYHHRAGYDPDAVVMNSYAHMLFKSKLDRDQLGRKVTDAYRDKSIHKCDGGKKGVVNQHDRIAWAIAGSYIGLGIIMAALAFGVILNFYYHRVHRYDKETDMTAVDRPHYDSRKYR